MGNYLGRETVAGYMVAQTPAVGIAHPTTVPTNFEPEESASGGREEITDDP